MKLLDQMTNRPVAVMMIYTIISVAGIFAISRLPLELLPDVELPQLSVQVSWPNTSPETIEAFITAPIEAICNTLKGVQNVSSSSRQGQAIIDVQFEKKTNMDFARLELNERLFLVRKSLPPGALSPEIVRFIPKEFRAGAFLTFHLYGDISVPELRLYALRYIRGQLQSLRGIADVHIIGGTEPVIQIELAPDICQALNIDVEKITRAIRQRQKQQSFGVLKTKGYRYAVQLEETTTIQDLQNIELEMAERTIRIGDIGRIIVTHNRPRRLKRINGQPAVVIDIFKKPGANSIETANRVRTRLKAIEKKFPANVHLIKVQDQSERIRDSINDLALRALFSTGIVFLILYIFLKKMLSPLIILATIFFAVLMTGLFLFMAQMTLNMLTLAGLALGFGMMVDNSVVVLDNIFRYHESGIPAQRAAVQASAHVFAPIAASTLTTVAALGPFLYMHSDYRPFYIPFALSVSLSLIASLCVAFSFTPVFAVKLLQISNIKAHAPESWLVSRYKSSLLWCLRRKTFVLSCVLLLLIGTGYLYVNFVSKAPVWYKQNQHTIDIRISLPKGTNIAVTDSIAQIFEAETLASGYAKQIICEIMDEQAMLHIIFPDSIQKTGFPIYLKEKLMVKASNIGNASVGVHGYGEGFFRGESRVMPSWSIKVMGYHYKQTKSIADALGERLHQNPKVRDIDTNSMDWWTRDDITEMVLDIDRRKLDRHRCSSFFLLEQIRPHLRENLSRQNVRLDGHDYELAIKNRGADQFDIESMKALQVRNPSGHLLRVGDMAALKPRVMKQRIDREKQQYQQIVSFNYRGSHEQAQKFVDSIIKTTQLAPGFKLENSHSLSWISEQESSQLRFILALSLSFVFIVLAALFESLRLPFLVMFSIPLGLIGVFIIYLVSGRSFDRGAYIGLVLLSGIVVNNAILLISHIKRTSLNGLPQTKAVVQASTDRLRPILMTSLTTILGLAPLIIKTQEGSLWSSLALSTMGGLTSATLLVLFVVPVLYTVVETESRKK